VYGEENHFWTGAEARAFARVSAIPSVLALRALSGDGGMDPPTARDA
jgi:hypothetical protein